MLLLKCADCGTMNGLDGQFCRQCGRSIPVADLARARQEMQELVADGERLMDQSRLPEAMAIASAAMEADPNFGPAVRLYGEILARQGRTADAVEALEHLARLEPENSTVRARIAELTAGSGGRRGPRLSPSMQIIVTALGLTLILVAVGSAFMLAAKPNKKDVPQVASLTEPNRSSFDVVAPVPAPDIVQSTAPSAQSASVTGVQQTTIPADPVPASTTPATQAPVQRQTVSTDPTLPSRGNDLRNLKPLPAKATGTDPEPGTAPLPTTDVAATKPVADPVAVPAVAKPTGTIEIKVRANQTTKTSGPVEATPNEVKVLISVARERYARGEYEGAAGAYEKALKAGADKGTTNQRLGGCYEKLGRKDDAITAYHRAIDAYTAQNTKNPEARLERAIQACKKAIEVLENGE